MTEHRYLYAESNHLSGSAAKKLALKTVREVVEGADRLTDGQLSHPDSVYMGRTPEGDEKKVRFADLVEEARKLGSVRTLRSVTDQKDPVFGGTYGLAVAEGGTISTKHHGPPVEARGPGTTYPLGPDLAEDILHYRRAICDNSTMANLHVARRDFRAYIFCCTALVESYLARCLWTLHSAGELTEGELNALPRRFDDYLKAWLPLFTTKTFEDLKQLAPCWGALKELREERHLYAHAYMPTLPLSYHKVCRLLNAAQTGVGRLLLTVREWQNLDHLGFLESLANAPEVKFKSSLPSRPHSKGDRQETHENVPTPTDASNSPTT